MWRVVRFFFSFSSGFPSRLHFFFPSIPLTTAASHLNLQMHSCLLRNIADTAIPIYLLLLLRLRCHLEVHRVVLKLDCNCANDHSVCYGPRRCRPHQTRENSRFSFLGFFRMCC